MAEESSVGNNTSKKSKNTNINNKKIDSIYIFTAGNYIPPLLSSSEVLSQHGATCSNGEAVGKGFTIQPGWKNEGLWEASFMFKHDNIRYTGICFLSTINYNGYGGSSTALTSWEGSFPGTSAYATYTSGSVGYFDITVTKIDDTHVRLKSETLNKESVIEVPWLANADMVTCGARHNTNSSYGPCRLKDLCIKNVPIKKKVSSITNINTNNIIYKEKEYPLSMEIYLWNSSYFDNQISQGANSFIGDDIIIDYGDGTIENSSNKSISHTYSSNGEYVIKIYGATGINSWSFNGYYQIKHVVMTDTITNIGEYCFSDCQNLKSVIIPKSVTSIGRYAFRLCTSLDNITLNWTNENDIIPYVSTTYQYADCMFNIPISKEAYVAKGYPSNKLVEQS